MRRGKNWLKKPRKRGKEKSKSSTGFSPTKRHTVNMKIREKNNSLCSPQH
jgi:hypothetical protein